MVLSKDSVNLLRWLSKHDEWKYLSEIEKQYRKFSYRSFKALKNGNLIESCVFEDEIPDWDEYGNQFYPEHYRISDAGKAYLESRISRWLPELREWIAIGISVVALAISIISLLS